MSRAFCGYVTKPTRGLLSILDLLLHVIKIGQQEEMYMVDSAKCGLLPERWVVTLRVVGSDGKVKRNRPDGVRVKP